MELYFMDRELTDTEKEKTKKKSHHRRNQPNGFISISYRFIITRAFIVVFLLLPSIIRNWTVTGDTPKGRHESRGFAPNPDEHSDPVIQIYAARTWGLKGMFAVHSWIAMKRKDAKNYEVCQVIGWKKGFDGNVLFRESMVPDQTWHGNEPKLILDLRGDQVESIIDKVDAAIQEYPWSKEYEVFPGPNSNTFVAWIGLKVPELGLDLPSTAIGKDWRPLKQSLGPSASGTGVQASLFGLLGSSIGFEEGLELNVLGLNVEFDLFDLSLEIPLFGRFGKWYLLCYLAIWLSLKMWIRKKELGYVYI